MLNPILIDIEDGTTCYRDRPKNINGYAIFRGNGQTLYARNDGSWVARYNDAAKKMDIGDVTAKAESTTKKPLPYILIIWSPSEK